MKALRGIIRKYRQKIVLTAAALLAIFSLYIFKLGSLAGGLSQQEISTANRAVGWHGIYHDPFYLPLNLVRSAAFFLRPDHGQTVTRVSNILFGLAAIAAFYFIAKVWYGRRIALVATVMFLTSAWTLHVSRYANYDVLYLWALPMLLLTHVAIRKYTESALVVLGCFITWLALLYIPGMIWFVLLTAFLQRKFVAEAWRSISNTYRGLIVATLLFGLPLLAVGLTRHDALLTWIGLPAEFHSPLRVAKDFAGVFVHLFIRGPQYPDVWLGKLPILDTFTLATCLAGLYFFLTHLTAFRSKLLLAYFVIGTILISLAGPVSISLLVPLMYIYAATGIAFLLHDWLKTFPFNGLARGLGIGLVALAVGLSCLYNLRAYFIAWPHNEITKATFRYHR
jgi:hypothetical protein